MIEKFGSETALLVIDAQVGVNLHDHWGGSCGHRNNPQSEQRIAELLAAWRDARRPVFFTLHNSREDSSPLKLSLDSGRSIPGLEPRPGEVAVIKNVNSGFTGTNLELDLRRRGISLSFRLGGSGWSVAHRSAKADDAIRATHEICGRRKQQFFRGNETCFQAFIIERVEHAFGSEVA